MEKEQKPEDEPKRKWEPVSNINKEKERRQEIIRKVEEHHKAYVDLWLSHLKGRNFR